jgi:hypothetical protein
MNNFVTVSLEYLPPEEQQKFKALQEYMRILCWRQEGLFRQGGRIERVRAAVDQAK